MSQFNNCTYYGNEKDSKVVEFLQTKISNNNQKLPYFNYESNSKKKTWEQRLIEFLIQLYHEKLCICISDKLFNNMFDELKSKDSNLKNSNKQVFYNISYKFFKEMKIGIESEIPNQINANKNNYNIYLKKIKSDGYILYEKMVRNINNSLKKGGNIKQIISYDDNKKLSNYKKDELVKIAKKKGVSLTGRDKKPKSKEQLYKSLKYYKVI